MVGKMPFTTEDQGPKLTKQTKNNLLACANSCTNTKKSSNRQKDTEETDRNIQKETEQNRNRQKQTETERNRPERIKKTGKNKH